MEEELFLVDPITGSQINASAAILARLRDGDVLAGSIEQELHASQVEMISEVCATAPEAVAMLGGLRDAVLETGAGLLGAGTHPAAVEGTADITDKDRYERIRHLLGDAAVTPIGGLHVHVGMPDAETAIRTYNGLREHLPLLAALAANSPFRHGRDTGLASAREVTIRAWPRSGVPRALRSFDDFCTMAELLTRAAGVPDYTWFWWKLRPHPRLGTVELRALDVQASLRDTAALVALTHCLARDAAEDELTDPSPSELIDEGLFRAARFGTQAELPDREGHLRPVSELLEEALAIARRHGVELGCERELARLRELLHEGGGAGRQRRCHEIAGMDALLRSLTEWTADTDVGPR